MAYVVDVGDEHHNKYDEQDFSKVPPLDFSWENIKYSVPVGGGLPCFRKGEQERKQILHPISGFVKAGESLAILGSSGAGKSTLLDILASRVKRRAFEGTIKVNGDANIRQYRHLAAYVPQADSLFPVLTVEESLMYSARLRLPTAMTDEDKKARVASVIKILGLTKCKDSQVGNDSIRGVSGGEKRRTSIGMELVTAPSLLFLDEPTSGLDSFSALNVVNVLTALARQGRTIVLTIHQPSSTIFRAFDKVMFLAEGRIVYYGPANQVVPFFSSIGHEIPPNTNPADFVLDVINIQQANGQLLALTDAYTAEGAKFQNESKAVVSVTENVLKSEYDRNHTDRPNVFLQTFWLAYRSFLVHLRQQELFFQRIGICIITALVMGSLYLRIGDHLYETKALEVVYFFAYTVALANYTSLASLPVFLDEKLVFKRERGSSYYSVLPYVLGTMIIQIPVLFVLSVLLAVLGYWLVGLVADAGAFFFYLLVLVVLLFTAQSFAMFISTIISDFGSGSAIATGFLSFSFLFGGTFVHRHDIPRYWIWFHYISIFKYPIDALAQNEFLNPKIAPILLDRCTVAGFNISSDPTCFISGQQFLQEQGFLSSLDKWADLGLLLLIGLIFRLGFYLTLRFLHTPQRK